MTGSTLKPNTSDTFRRGHYGVRPLEVCGRRLQPFTLAHAYFLEAVASPYARGGTPDETDLLLAILACSTAPQDIAGMFLHVSEDVLIQRCADFRAGLTDRQLLDAVEPFHAWLDASTTGPRHLPRLSKDKGTPHKAPWQWALVHMLVQHRIVDRPAQAWAMPLVEAMCWNSVIAEANGDDTLTDDRWHEMAALAMQGTDGNG